MHRAASRLVFLLQDASVKPTAASLRAFNRAPQAVTSACFGCHATNRLR